MTLPHPSLPCRLHALLSDGAVHSGHALAAACGASRGAIRQALEHLRELGAEVQPVAGRGYRMPAACPPLAADLIRERLPRAVTGRLRSGASLWSTGSTNADLLARADLPPGQFDFLTAEYQSAGRGRRSRGWFAPPGGAICLSLSWTFPQLPRGLGALGLATGVWALRALGRCGVGDVRLKWPNDLVVEDRKLGGILVELRTERAGHAFVVIGIGLNVALGKPMLERVLESGTSAIDLASLTPAVDRNALAAALVAAFVEGLLQFAREGFDAFAAEWRGLDALAGRAVEVRLEEGIVAGHARGIDAEGALCVQTASGLRRFTSGDASVRAAT